MLAQDARDANRGKPESPAPSTRVFASPTVIPEPVAAVVTRSLSEPRLRFRTMAPLFQAPLLMEAALLLREAPPTTRTGLGPAPSPAIASSGRWTPATAAETSSCPFAG